MLSGIKHISIVVRYIGIEALALESHITDGEKLCVIVVSVLLRTDVIYVFLIGIGGIHTHKSAVMSVVIALGGAVAIVGEFLAVCGEEELEAESREPINVLTNAAAEGVFDLTVALYGYVELIVKVGHTGDTRKGSVYGYVVARKGAGIDL